MNNTILGKNMENVTKYRGVMLVTTNKRINYLVSGGNYHAAKLFSVNLLAIAMKKAKVKMNKPIYLRLSILQISKTLIYEIWYDYIKPNTMQNYATWMQTILLFISKLKMLLKTL